ncbi:hypothetical protein [Paenibacillus sp. PAMC21692]|uniref:hypothetical protein n=1 Tax=Paenibacillus sp. PAMC21692 TaxID=2762320 RepID=UPI00164ED81E|nr:hypothetical protein [Paenibacillus sp. PAMC21692]QNK55146.1 hypothetical protein H7F31_21275 [Paenibacillus sp. PAMC21692]
MGSNGTNRSIRALLEENKLIIQKKQEVAKKNSYYRLLNYILLGIAFILILFYLPVVLNRNLFNNAFTENAKD